MFEFVLGVVVGYLLVVVYLPQWIVNLQTRFRDWVDNKNDDDRNSPPPLGI